TYPQTVGTVSVATAGNSSGSLASFDLSTAAGTSVTISGGTIVLQNTNSGTLGPRDFRNSAGTQNISGGTLQLGNASTPAAATFFLSGSAPGLHVRSEERRVGKERVSRG